MNVTKKIVTAASAGVLAGLGVGLVAAQPASAAMSTCSGSLIQLSPIKYGTTTIGELAVYYNSATGRNCARTNHSGVTWGKRLPTDATLWECKETRPGQLCTKIAQSNDRDYYSYYAGPVSVPGAGHCIVAYGGIYYGGAWRWNPESLTTSHCG